jgi:tetratricopeptide (TPR) repeat protein
MEEGKLKAATTLSAKLNGARGELESSLYINSSRDAIARLDPDLPVALRTGDWEQVTGLLKASPLPARQQNLSFLAREFSAFAAGMQAVEARDDQRATELSAHFDAEFRRMAAQPSVTPASGTATPALQVMPDALLPPLLRSLSVMSLELKASALVVQGQTAEAKTLFAKAAQAEKALGYHEPPADIRTVAEAEASAMMTIEDWADAKAAYEKALLDRPRSGFALYGIALCEEKTGESDTAVKAYADFLAAWKDADPALAQVSHARSYLAAHDHH